MKTLLWLFLVVTIISSCQPTSPATAPRPALDTPARMDTLSIPSASMDKNIPAIVILPAGYEAAAPTTYPVVYLLHGAFGNFTGWSTGVPELTNYASEQELIIVCPDGGYTSWYWDSPIDPEFKYETHIIKEVIPYIDSVFRTRPQADQRAITGLSMGGHGALYLAARHPDVFQMAGSMSGGVDFRPFPEKWDIKERLGSLENFQERWTEHTVVNHAAAFAKNDQDLIIDCGTDDFFFEVNEDLHRILMDLDVEHDYIVRPGVHDWNYWNNAVEYQLLFFDKAFNRKG
jgi:S-formylglutathione hydrolase FrmB